MECALIVPTSARATARRRRRRAPRRRTSGTCRRRAPPVPPEPAARAPRGRAPRRRPTARLRRRRTGAAAAARRGRRPPAAGTPSRLPSHPLHDVGEGADRGLLALPGADEGDDRDLVHAQPLDLAQALLALVRGSGEREEVDEL